MAAASTGCNRQNGRHDLHPDQQKKARPELLGAGSSMSTITPMRIGAQR
jgi:hypothetical protein